MDSSEEDQRLPHRQEPNVEASLEKLASLGVRAWQGIVTEDPSTDATYNDIRSSMGFNYEDEITCCPEKLENYEEKIKMFFQEHIHNDDEVRFCMDGSGYFDVRDENDAWIRIRVTPGDLITLPAGIYHRFTLDENDYIKAKRLFIGDPVWTPLNRPQEENPIRQQYVSSLVNEEEESKN
jgi:1,2-dihydroxy-3-keto-5-methylthiopentene dioxygenase